MLKKAATYSFAVRESLNPKDNIDHLVKGFNAAIYTVGTSLPGATNETKFPFAKIMPCFRYLI